MTIFRNAVLALLIAAMAGPMGCTAEQSSAEKLHETLGSLKSHPDVLALKEEPEALAERMAAMAAVPTMHYSGQSLAIMLYGLSVKGSGGGGGLVDGFDIWLTLDLEKGVDIHDIRTVQDDKLYIVVGGLGAPSVLKQNLDGLINAIERSMNKLAQLKDKQIGGVLSVESGPVNSMLAILLSQRLDVPLIDVDGAGRSVPSLTNLTYAYESYPVAPVVAGSALDPTRDLIVSYPQNAAQAEDELRKAASQLGGLIGIALWGQTGAELKASSVVRDPFFNAFWLGLWVVLSVEDPPYLAGYFKATDDYIGGYLGKLTRFKIDSSGGFDKIYLDVSLPGGSVYTINAVNEDLLMQQTIPQQRTAVTAPHIIGYLVQFSSGQAYLPFTTATSMFSSRPQPKSAASTCWRRRRASRYTGSSKVSSTF